MKAILLSEVRQLPNRLIRTIESVDKNVKYERVNITHPSAP